MGRSVRQPLKAYVPERVRRAELIRPAQRRRDFTTREAQRRLQQKESRWAPIAYGVALAAVVIIFLMAYTSYAFSRYRGEILPGVQVDTLPLGGLTQKQASARITNRLAAIHLVPVELTYGSLPPWKPSADEIGLSYQVDQTAKTAFDVGRAGPFVEQWIDRLPLHTAHTISLQYSINEKQLRQYLRAIASRTLYSPSRNARLTIDQRDFHVSITPSREGTHLNLPDAEQAVHAALGSLTIQTETLHVNRSVPAITNADASKVRDRVERFLAHPPIINVGKRVFVSSRSAIAPMLSFSDTAVNKRPTIVMSVDPNKVRAYISALAAQIDRPALDAKLQFAAGQVQIIHPQQTGRSLDQVAAYQALLPVVTGLKRNARLHFKVASIAPPSDQSNPASLGINTLLATGETSFTGAGPTRLNDITTIARVLNQDLLPPGQDISFNALVAPNGSGWLDRVYSDHERQVNNQLVPSGSGAMQQVATTFLRALYNAGLKLEERHAHVYRLGWYEPPVGYDAIVAPGRNWDLRFANSTHKYLLIETRVEPVQQTLYIYVYGPRLGWKVSVDQQGKVTKVYPHGGQITREDPSLSPGTVRQISFAHNGADTVVQRTIAYPNGRVSVDEIDTHYSPSNAILTIGSPATPTPTATPTARPKKQGGAGATPTPTPSPGPSPSPSPTFNH
jgi:vancomycin resistance protein YoaR